MFSRLLIVAPLLTVFAADPPKLSIVQLMLHEYEDGPSISASFRFQGGEGVFLSFRVAGFQTTPGEEKRLKLSYTIQAEDELGVPLEPASTGMVETTLNEQDKEWLPKIRNRFSVPPLADPGSYRVRITVKDELAGVETRAEVPFDVRGRIVEPSETLTIRNFRFLRGEEDAPRGLDPPAYRPGDPVFARFEITGYKFGEKNRLSVEYGIEVLNPDGERIFAEETAASEELETFYPKRHVEGALQLGFKPALAQGEYAVVITLRDLVGNQNHEERFLFRVE